MIKKPVIFLILCTILGFAHTQILAIDYGTKFIKAALVHVGAGKSFSIVENHKFRPTFMIIPKQNYNNFNKFTLVCLCKRAEQSERIFKSDKGR